MLKSCVGVAFNRRVLLPGAAGLGILALTWTAPLLNPLQMASAVYLFGDPDLLRDAEVPFHRDGKSATVNLIRYREGTLAVTTNGKTDAAIQMRDHQPPSSDELTMTLLGALPLAVHPDAERIAVIGFGSGLTTHSVLGSPRVERVDTIEIEPAMIEAARRFRPRVERAFADPRSHLYIDDARSFFSSAQTDYDIIVSEPSNPWVSGIASLYTREFYHFVRGHLRERGVFAQWLHVYDLNLALFASVISAMAESFPDYVVFNLNGMDVLIIAGDSLASRASGLDRSLPEPVLADLARLGVRADDLLGLRIGSRTLLQPLFDSYLMPVNSDYFPILDLHAVRARFLQHNARDLFNLQTSPLPLLDMLAARDVPPAEYHRPLPAATTYLARSTLAKRIARYLTGSGPLPDDVDPSTRQWLDIVSTNLWLGECRSRDIEPLWLEMLLELAGATVPYLSDVELEPIWHRFAGSLCDGENRAWSGAWLELVRATSRRAAGEMLAAAFELLNSHAGSLTPAQLGRVVSSAMLAASHRGDKEMVRRLWQVHGQNFTEDYARAIDLRFMAALAGAFR